MHRLEHDHAHVRPPGMSGQTAQGGFVAGAPGLQAGRRRAGPPGGRRRAPRPATSPRRRPAAGRRAASAGQRRAPGPPADRRSDTGRGRRRSRRAPGPGQGSAAQAQSCRSNARRGTTTLTPRGRPPVPSNASSRAKPVGTISLLSAWSCGRRLGWAINRADAEADLDRGASPARLEPGECRAERWFCRHLRMIEQMF